MGDHIAKEYVDRCRANVMATLAGLAHARASDTLSLAVHRSISIWLHQQLRTVQFHNPESKIIPGDLLTKVGSWKENLSRQTLMSLVRLRASQWRACVIELVLRLDADWNLLVAHLELDPNAKLSAISEPLGDSHHRGRSVYRLDFDDGTSVVYKPRPVEAEFTFGRVVEWLGNAGYEPTLASCRVLCRNGYGWTQYIESQFCASDDEAEAYFERQGAFLGLFFLFCGGDGNHENVVVHGRDPIWIDTECMCSPSFCDSSGRTLSLVPSWMNASVLKTLLLYYPNEMGFPPRRLSGLGVECTRDRAQTFDADDILYDRYINAVTKGFTTLYEWIASHQRAWIADDGALFWWCDQRVRVVFASTMFYSALAESLLVAPADVKRLARQEIERILWSRAQEHPWRAGLLQAELNAITNGDVPYWSMSTSGRDVFEAHGYALRGVVERTGMENIFARAHAMSIKDLENQLWLIRTFLRVRTPVESTAAARGQSADLHGGAA